MYLNNVTIYQGRSSGMKALRIRGNEISKLANEKNVIIGWDNIGTNYQIYIESITHIRIFEETVLTRGVVTVEKINAFYDIFEKELENINL
jgi:hypothetical protein